MIEINLLPEGLRPKRRDYLKLDVQMGKLGMFAGIGCLAILILLPLIFSFGSYIRAKQIRKLLAKETGMAGQKAEVDEINNRIAVLKARADILDKITRRKFLWAKKLNELSDLILPGIWYTHIHTEAENKLLLEGSVISKKQEAMATVGKFMKGIREHRSFFKDFTDIKLESIQRKYLEKREVLDFKIALYF